MKFSILTQYYPPEIGAPQARLSALASQLTTQGHQVTVLTAMPNYPTGKVFDNYGRLFQREKRNEAAVLRTWIYPTQKPDYIHRLTNYMSFMLSSAIAGSFTLGQSDYLMVESPPLFLGLSAYLLSRLKRTRLIFNVSDLWPDSLITLGMLTRDHWGYQVSAKLEAFLYKKAWLVSGQTKGIVEDIRSRFPQCKAFHLSNGVNTEQFDPNKYSESVRQELTRDKEFVLLYAGLHGLAQGLDQLISVAERFDSNSGIRFVLIGDGPEKAKLVEQAAEKHLSNVTFLDPRPFLDMPAFLAAADAIVVPLKVHIAEAAPSKLYEAMASAKPVLLIASGEAADIVQQHQAGYVVKPGDIENLELSIRVLAQQPSLCKELGTNGRRAAEQYYDRSVFIQRFIDYLVEHQ